jgi:demethylmenaquinone methyltransferase/2-methoxy-6-polyprenyl-1,4-benzoquinol methylase
MHDAARAPSSGQIVRPHPPLQAYYDGEEGRRAFVRAIFDETAGDYDRVERMMALGSGAWHRRRVLVRAGLRPGMDFLDVAVGTGLVAREAVAIVGDPTKVVGLDPSIGMLRQARRSPAIPCIQGTAENIPCPDERFDFVSMGYALRHLADLAVVFREFHRVLRPGGALCIQEITRPDGRLRCVALKVYMRTVVPAMARVVARRAETALLMRYFWDTIEACVPPERVLDALRGANFVDIRRRVDLGVFTEYFARKPRGSGPEAPGS